MNTREYAELLRHVFENNWTAFVAGAPGIGKTEIFYQVANELGYQVSEERLYQRGEWAAGIADIVESEGKLLTMWTLPEWIRDIQLKQREGKVALLLDDFHLVPPAIQSIMYQFLERRCVNQHCVDSLPIVIVGNFNTASAHPTKVPPPVMSRAEIFVEVEPDEEDLVRYWGKHNVRSEIIAFVRAYPQYLFTTDPTPTKMFPCPRSWWKLNEVSRVLGLEAAPMVVGEEAGAKFLDVLPVMGKPVEELLKPDKSDQALNVLKTEMLVSHILKQPKKKARQVIETYLERFPAETTMIFVNDYLSRSDPEQTELFLSIPTVAKRVKELNKDMKGV